jgi:CRISPR-associated protein Csd1
MTMLEGLVRYYERLEKTGVVAPPGYSSEKIAFLIVLDAAGNPPEVRPHLDDSKKPKPKPLMVSQPVKRTSGAASNFLWDKTAYVFGVSATSKRAAKEHEEFRSMHEQLLAQTNDEGLVAFLVFLRRWNPAEYREIFSRYADDMLDQNVAFVFRSKDETLGFLHERDAAKRIWADHLAGSASDKGLCLVTGEEGPIARLHPSIKNIARPGQPIPKLIAIDKDSTAFASFGKEQGANAPVTERAVHAYATALNALLSLKEGVDQKGYPRWKNRVQIGDATTVFWAEAEGGPEAAEAAETIISWTLDPPAPTDEQEAAKVQSVLQKIEAGRTIEKIEELGGKLDSKTRFYVLGLSPNAARLSVRFYQESTLGDMIEHAHEHFRDLLIEPHSWTVPPALWRFLRETAVLREADNVSPALAGEFARAVLTGGLYPRALLALTLMRIRADGDINDLRAALCKAYLARARRKDLEQNSPDPEEDVPLALDRDERNSGYRLGRLFAILERAQYAALGDVNANIRDKYFSSASANPARVFPLLLRGVQDHLGKVRSKGGGGLAYWFDEQIAEVMSGLPSSEPFPSTLRLEDQGRFAVGYYHQRNAAKERRDAEELAAKETEEA